MDRILQMNRLTNREYQHTAIDPFNKRSNIETKKYMVLWSGRSYGSSCSPSCSSRSWNFVFLVDHNTHTRTCTSRFLGVLDSETVFRLGGAGFSVADSALLIAPHCFGAWPGALFGGERSAPAQADRTRRWNLSKRSSRMPKRRSRS